MASKVLDCFSMLLRDKASDRIDGAAKLALYYLKTKKENEDSKEANHVLTRLVRGLGTSKASSRKGFYIAFHQILSNDSTITIDHIFSIMNTELKSSKSNSKSEVADINNGRILACGAMIRSGLLKTSSLEDQKKVLECLIHSGKQRSYLGFESMSFIVEFLNQFEDKDSLKPIWSVIEPEICKPISEQTLDTFYVILVILDKFPKIISKKTLKAQFGNENIINEESMKDIIKILTDIPRVICYKHPIYKIFTQKLVEANLVESFWLGIDQAFTRPSQTLQTVGIELFNLILANLKDKALISVLISPNFFKYMLKRFSYDPKHKKDDVAMNFKKALTELVTLLDKDVKTKVQINVLKKLIINPGDIMIEKVTGTKIIQILTNNLNADGVKKVASIYRDIATNTKFKEKDESESWSNCARIQVIQMLSVKLLGHKAVQQEKEWRVEQLKFLFEIGLCESSNIGVDLQSHFKESFYRALDNKLPKLDDLREVLTSLINFIDESVFKSSELKLRQPLEETATASWSKMLKLLKKLNKIDDQTGVVFHTMIMHMGLQLFFDPELAVTSIDDLQSCYEHVKLSKKKANDEPEWVEVVVDLILSLLSHKSHLLRSLVSCVFPHVCPHLNVQAMQQILEVLDVKSRKNPLKSNPDSDSEEEDESMDEDDEDNSDEEKNGDATNGNANNEDEEKEEDEEDSDSDESDEDDDESENDETLTDRLRLAVQSALGSAANPETDDAEDMDVDNIDEEEGKRLDESLAAAFRILKENRKRQSKKQEKDAQALTHFRTRVLDLLEMYFESEPSMALALDTLVPLFALLEFSIQDAHQRPLEMRVRGCLKKLSGVKKFKEIDVDGEVLTTILKALIEKGERSTMVCQEMGDRLAECCVFLVRCSQQIEGCTDSFVTIFCENLQAFFTQRSCALPSFLFKSLLQLCWVGNWKLAPLLVDYAFNQTLRKYRRGQALELLKVFFNNHRLMKLEEFASERESLEKKLGENITKSNTENLDLSKNTKTSLNKLAARIGVPIVLKRQAPQVDQDEASDSKKKKTTKED